MVNGNHPLLGAMAGETKRRSSAIRLVQSVRNADQKETVEKMRLSPQGSHKIWKTRREALMWGGWWQGWFFAGGKSGSCPHRDSLKPSSMAGGQGGGREHGHLQR